MPVPAIVCIYKYGDRQINTYLDIPMVKLVQLEVFTPTSSLPRPFPSISSFSFNIGLGCQVVADLSKRESGGKGGSDLHYLT